MPGVEVGLEALRGAPPQEVAIPQAEPVELGAVGGVERGEVAAEIARVEHPLLELAERLQERVGEARGARRAGETVQRRVRERAADDQGALRVGRDRTLFGIVADEPCEEVVEGADGAAEETALARDQVALDTVDVRRVRHDQGRLVVEARQIALEQERDLARVRRPCEKGESHLPIVKRAQDGSCRRSGPLFRSKR